MLVSSSTFRITVLIAVLYCLSNHLFAQKEINNWSFSNRTWFSFNNEPPEYTTSVGPGAYFGAATLSDRDGNIMLMGARYGIYSPALKNLKHPQMIHDTSRYAKNLSATFVAHPADSNLIYYFVSDGNKEEGSTALQYSVIKKQSDTEAELLRNRTVVLPLAVEHHAVVMNSKRDGYWIVTGSYTENCFCAYEFTKEGLSTVPVKSPSFMMQDVYGNIIFNKQGTMACVLNYESDVFEIIHFNNETGEFSPPLVLSFVDKVGTSYWFGNKWRSAEFSASGEKLYIMSDTLFQYDLSVFDKTAIESSVAIVDPRASGDIKRGTDGRIYYGITYYNRGEASVGKTAVLENPDAENSALQKGLTKISFNTHQFPHTVPYVPYIYQDTVCNKDTVLFKFRGIADSVSWDFGDPLSNSRNAACGFSAEHYYQSPGEYVVEAQYTYCDVTYSVIDTVHIQERRNILTPDEMRFCENGILNAPAGYDAYAWNTGGASQHTQAETEGMYYLKVSEADCSFYDSIHVQILPQAPVPEIKNTSSCQGLPIVPFVADSALASFAEIIWYSGPEEADMIETGHSFQPTIYMLEPGQENLFYVRSQMGTCLSEAKELTYSYYQKPAKPVVEKSLYNACVPTKGYASISLSAQTENCRQLVWYNSKHELLPQCEASCSCGLPEINKAGDYLFYVQLDEGNCKSDFTEFHVNAYDEPEITIAGSDSVCKDDRGAEYTVTGLAVPADTCYWFAQDPLGLDLKISDEKGLSATADYKSSGVYTIGASVETAGCVLSATKTITVAEKPVPLFEVNNTEEPGLVEITDLSIQPISGTPKGGISPQMTYFWDYGFSDAGEYVPMDEDAVPVPFSLVYPQGKYDIRLKLENDFGCSSEPIKRHLIIDVSGNLFFPNAFAPESETDLVSIFQPVGSNIKAYKIWVYDSWGNIVWYSDKLNLDFQPAEFWDGTYKGKKLQTGVYTFKCEAEFIDGSSMNSSETHFGSVLLLR